MVQSVGIDIVDIERFEKTINKWGDKFLNRILSPKELDYCKAKHNAIHSMAARFAAKEALIKCLNDNDQIGFSWQDMEIINANNGRPVVHLRGKMLSKLQNVAIHVSLSHSPSSAVAVIVLEKKENNP